MTDKEKNMYGKKMGPLIANIFKLFKKSKMQGLAAINECKDGKVYRLAIGEIGLKKPKKKKAKR